MTGTIVWPVVYALAALAASGVLVHDAFSVFRGRVGDAARWLPILALVVLAAATRSAGVFPIDPPRADLWLDVLRRADVAVVLGWGLVASLVPSMAPRTPLGALLRGLSASARIPDDDRGPIAAVGRALAPLAWAPLVFGVPLLGPALPFVPAALLLAHFAVRRADAPAPKFAAHPVERAIVAVLAVSLLQLSGAFLHLGGAVAATRAEPLLVFGVAAVLGVALDPVLVALTLARTRAVAVEPEVLALAAPALAGAVTGRAFLVAVGAQTRAHRRARARAVAV